MRADSTPGAPSGHVGSGTRTLKVGHQPYLVRLPALLDKKLSLVSMPSGALPPRTLELTGVGAPPLPYRITDFGAPVASWVGPWARGTLAEPLTTFEVCQSEGYDDWNGAICHQGIQEAVFTLAYWHAMRAGGALLHSASFQFGASQTLVAGVSDAGKSTLCARLPEHYLHEENALLRPEGGGWVHMWAASTVWRASKLPHPLEAPVGAICILGKDRSRTYARRMSEAEAIEALFSVTLNVPGTPTSMVLDATTRLAAQLPVFELSHSLETPTDELIAQLEEVCHVGP